MERFDERDIPFSRARLRPGTPEYAAYYAMRPENREIDDAIRALPGLLSPEASLAEPGLFAAAEGSFFLTGSLRDAVDGPVAADRAAFDPAGTIDGCYQVIAPLVARDAGLGEIGRMGLLMTPRLGPRVRLGAVTTALELVPDRPGSDPTVLDLCQRCRKCAANCPASAIPDGDRVEIDGDPRWRIDADACFRYWNVTGTDCARCLAVCPCSHAANAFHNAVRWAIRRSSLFRRAAVRLDDAFYGRKPAPGPSPSWADPRTFQRH